MKFDVEYLAGLEIAEKDGKVRVLRVPFIELSDAIEADCNNILIAFQNQGYEVLSVVPGLCGMVSGAVQGLWVTYK